MFQIRIGILGFGMEYVLVKTMFLMGLCENKLNSGYKQVIGTYESYKNDLYVPSYILDIGKSYNNP